MRIGEHQQEIIVEPLENPVPQTVPVPVEPIELPEPELVPVAAPRREIEEPIPA